MAPKTSMPDRAVGMPDILALVPISGCPSFSINARAVFEFGTRKARRPVLPVTRRGTRADAGTIRVKGPGQNLRPRIKKRDDVSLHSSSAIMMSDTSSGNERCASLPLATNTLPTACKFSGSATSAYKRVGWNRHQAAFADDVGGSRNRLLRWLVLLDFEEIGGHFLLLLPIPDGFGDLNRHVVTAKRRAQLDACHQAFRPQHHLLCDGNPLGSRLFWHCRPGRIRSMKCSGTGTRSSFTMNSAFR